MRGWFGEADWCGLLEIDVFVWPVSTTSSIYLQGDGVHSLALAHQEDGDLLLRVYYDVILTPSISFVMPIRDIQDPHHPLPQTDTAAPTPLPGRWTNSTIHSLPKTRNPTPPYTHLGIPRARLDEEVERLLVTSSGVLPERPVHQEEGDAGVLYLVFDSVLL